MAQTAKKNETKGHESAEPAFTYQGVGEIRTLEQMLQVQTTCGEKRYVLMDASLGEPAGTLADKLDLLQRIKTIAAQNLAAEQKRRQEGHRYDPKADQTVSLR